jgi:hypothetical protein
VLSLPPPPLMPPSPMPYTPKLVLFRGMHRAGRRANLHLDLAALAVANAAKDAADE